MEVPYQSDGGGISNEDRKKEKKKTYVMSYVGNKKWCTLQKLWGNMVCPVALGSRVKGLFCALPPSDRKLWFMATPVVETLN